MDVHIFDGKLTNIFKPLKKYSDLEKENLFSTLKGKLSRNANDMLNIMVSDKQTNFQAQNNLDATDILADILCRDYLPILNLLDEQLSDTKLLGQCDSGRVTRLLQIWSAIVHI
jgi:hypothetical protein